jgi:hypothetical protein
MRRKWLFPPLFSINFRPHFPLIFSAHIPTSSRGFPMYFSPIFLPLSLVLSNEFPPLCFNQPFLPALPSAFTRKLPCLLSSHGDEMEMKPEESTHRGHLLRGWEAGGCCGDLISLSAVRIAAKGPTGASQFSSQFRPLSLYRRGRGGRQE